MPNVLQPWISELTFMQQTVLLTAIRGPDGLHKNHPSKSILRWFRRSILYAAFEKKIFADPHTVGGGSFTGPCAFTTIGEAVNRYLESLDEIPLHFHMHLIHAAEIIGYQHPNVVIREWWKIFYLRCVNDLHLNPESKKQMEKRLGDNFDDWKQSEDFCSQVQNPLDEEDDT